MHHPYFKALPQTPLSQLRSALPERDALEYRSPPVSKTYRITDSFKPTSLHHLEGQLRSQGRERGVHHKTHPPDSQKTRNKDRWSADRQGPRTWFSTIPRSLFC